MCFGVDQSCFFLLSLVLMLIQISLYAPAIARQYESSGLLYKYPRGKSKTLSVSVFPSTCWYFAIEYRGIIV